MPSNRPNEPSTPATTPGERKRPKIPDDQIPQSEDELLESESERQQRESEAALDRSVGQLPPD